MSKSGIERRDVLLIFGGGALGAAAYAVGESIVDLDQNSNFLEIRTRQLKEQYDFLQEQDALEKLKITEPTLWFHQALIGADREGAPKLIIPVKPRVTLVQLIGVEDEGIKTIRLRNVVAKMPNMRNSTAYFDQEFLYKNLLESESLTDLPQTNEHFGFSGIHFWTRGDSLYIKEERCLEGLSFSVSVFYETYLSSKEVIDNNGFVGNLRIANGRIVGNKREWERSAVTLNYEDLGGRRLDVSALKGDIQLSATLGTMIYEVDPTNTNSEFNYYLI